MIKIRDEFIERSVKIFIDTFLQTEKDRKILNEIYDKSYAQMYQDMFVLWYRDFKRNGYFVDFGATDGKHINNTYLLEKEFGWTGIVAEPAQIWHQDLYKNRNCHIDTNCVWHTSNQQVEFDQSQHPEWSTMPKYITNTAKMYRGSDENNTKYLVNTISLNDLLNKYNAPYEIDFISLDTEGSELDILQAFDFSKHKVYFIGCEHNDHHEGNAWYRENIFDFLSSKGYERVWTHLSCQDDWYVLKDIIKL